jgi:hypothetical protein
MMLSNSKLILKSIKNKKVLSLIEKALINGDFKNSPAIAKFLLTSVLNKNYNSDQDLLKIIYNVIGGRPATIEQLTSEEKIIRRKSQVAVLVKDYKINS